MGKTFFEDVYTIQLNELGSLYRKKEEAEAEKDILISVHDALKEKIAMLNNQISENASQNTYSNKIKNAERKFVNTENIVLFIAFVFIIINGIHFSELYESTYKFLLATILGTGASTTFCTGLYILVKDFIAPRIGRKDDETFNSGEVKVSSYDLKEELELYTSRLKIIESKIASSDSYIRLLNENLAIIKNQIRDFENQFYPNTDSLEKGSTKTVN